MCVSKKDFCWVIAFAVFALITILTFWLGGKGNEIVSYISFASALISIVLALVAILYSFFQNVNSQQNIGEMKTLVSTASKIITDKADILAETAKSMANFNKDLYKGFLKHISAPATIPSDKISIPVFFNTMITSELTRLFVFFLWKSNTLRKTLRIQQFVDIVKPLVRMSETELSSHVYGILHGLACCLQAFLLVKEQTEVQLLKLPENFETSVKDMVASMTNRSSDLAKCLDQIDNLT